MGRTNRLKPDPTSRPTLKELENNRILQRHKIGIYNVIRAETGLIEPIGLDLRDFRVRPEHLPNFHPNAPRVSAWVGYEKGRAELTATHGHKGWEGTPYDLSSVFPLNTVAGDLLRQPDTKCNHDVPCDIYGDAILVTDARMHWMLWLHRVEAEEIEAFDDMLTTPRQMLKPWERANPLILFHEEPNHHDLVMLKLRWM